MDQLFSTLPKRTYLISSSDIPDATEGVDVGADDMLITAINQMNRSNGRYVFLDQARISGFGQLEIVTTQKEDEIKPQLYIRGSISQRDADTSDDEASVNHAAETGSKSLIIGAFYRGHRKLSVISVDLHLVQYPSRRILQGASVANSMVVVEKGFKGSAVGIIDNAVLTVPVTIQRIESESQAVRNLIELGIIELLGRHSGVPYWTCLESSSTDARAAGQDERQFVQGSTKETVHHAQGLLIQLGLLKGEPTGVLSASTRRAISIFQARENLVPSGTVDFDLIQRLERGVRNLRSDEQALAEAPPPRQTAPAPAPRPQPVAAPQPSQPASGPSAAQSPMPACLDLGGCDENYQNLYDLIQDQFN